MWKSVLWGPSQIYFREWPGLFVYVFWHRFGFHIGPLSFRVLPKRTRLTLVVTLMNTAQMGVPFVWGFPFGRFSTETNGQPTFRLADFKTCPKVVTMSGGRGGRDYPRIVTEQFSPIIRGSSSRFELSYLFAETFGSNCFQMCPVDEYGRLRACFMPCLLRES